MKDGLFEFGADQPYTNLSGVEFSNCRLAGATQESVPLEGLQAAYREGKG